MRIFFDFAGRFCHSAPKPHLQGDAMKPKTIFAALAAFAAALLLAACSTLPAPPAKPLRVGFTANYPPVCTERDGMPAGLEYDFAKALAKELGRPLEIVELPWERQIGALLDGSTDIIMSGMTATPGRSARVRFCTPYMVNPLVAMCRAGDQSAAAGPDKLLSGTPTVGVLHRTSAEDYATHHFIHARIVPLSKREDAPIHLANHRIDYYLDDFAAVANLISADETRLSFLPHAFQGQNLCWAVRPDQDGFRHECDRILARWKESGELDRMLLRWMPYLESLR
jgi:polar amino acid transport system substrate-binding protein